MSQEMVRNIARAWSDDEVVRIHPAALDLDAVAMSPRMKKRSPSPTPSSQPSVIMWFPGMLSTCLSFLDLQALHKCESVSKEWHRTAQQPSLWEHLYCVLWRRGVPLPTASTSSTAAVGSTDRAFLKSVCKQRSTIPLVLSTRAQCTVTNYGTIAVVNNCLERRFRGGAVESICTAHELEPMGFFANGARAVCYFEVRTEAQGSIGLVSTLGPEGNRFYGVGSSYHVGWFPVSYGYHSDDGRLHWNEGVDQIGGRDLEYGPTWGKPHGTPAVVGNTPRLDADTVIGCGYEMGNGQLFFTKNGSFLSYASVRVNLTRQYAAAVSIHEHGQVAEINLGRAPFAFDLENYVANTHSAP